MAKVFCKATDLDLLFKPLNIRIESGRKLISIGLIVRNVRAPEIHYARLCSFTIIKSYISILGVADIIVHRFSENQPNRNEVP